MAHLHFVTIHPLEDGNGRITSSKWAKIAGCSQDTAGRDIKALIERGALTKDDAGGRSTSYSIAHQHHLFGAEG